MKFATINGRCCGCKAIEDSFNRADSTNVGADWTEVVGDWEIVSNELRISTTGAIIITSVDCPNPIIERISVSVRIPAAGDHFRLILAYVDENNCLFAEFVSGLGSSAAIIYERSGGVNTQIVSSPALTFTTGSFVTASFCIREGNAVASCGVANTVSVETDFAPNGFAGIGTGSTVSATIRINSAEATFIRTRIPGYDYMGSCPQCLTCDFFRGTADIVEAKSQYDITVAGLVDGTEDCDPMNGTFTLDYNGNCEWYYQLTAGGNPYTWVMSTAQTSPVGNAELTVGLHSGAITSVAAGGLIRRWRAEITDRDGPNTLNEVADAPNATCSAYPATITVEAA